MTREEKELLLKDLCARLPYFENWVQYEGKNYIVTGYGHGRVSLLSSPFSSASGPCPLAEEVRPYLRPMSSMTEEECKELGDLQATIENVGEILPNAPYYIEVARPEQLDWLNAHHFDYRGLIEKGIALEAPDGMYKTE